MRNGSFISVREFADVSTKKQNLYIAGDAFVITDAKNIRHSNDVMCLGWTVKVVDDEPMLTAVETKIIIYPYIQRGVLMSKNVLELRKFKF